MSRAARRVVLAAAAVLGIAGVAVCAVQSQVQAAALAPAAVTGGDSYLLTLDGRIMQAVNAEVARPPASLTKLLTALVVLDARWSPDRWLQVSAAAAASEPSRLGLRAGDSVKAGDLLIGMLVHSANDACAVLVEHAAASQTEFLRLMNQRAQALGMSASHFSSPCGFDAADQYATASDLLRLGMQAFENPLIHYIAALPAATIQTRAGRRLHFQSTNALLGRQPDVVGLKTGYTSQAGECLIAVAEKDDHRLWLVMLGAQDRWWSAHRMISAALANLSETAK